MIKHCVLFRFKDAVGADAVSAAEKRFLQLEDSIPEITGFEWGLNNSPEGKDKGFTHLFQLSFRNSADRDKYLVDPVHTAFSASVRELVEDVLVFDYEIK